MATPVKANQSATLTFTLPISCQICLGKVKEPVVCPNQHVFCKVCLEVWLQRNNQCPACRVVITEDNPCRPVIGGLNQQDANEERFSSKELRKARVELLYKEYENELERVTTELDHLRQENQVLHERVKALGQISPEHAGKMTSKEADMQALTQLTKKLQDATGLYEKVKKEHAQLKKENSVLTDEAVNLRRENQTLRLEVTSRSPRKFGRYTVAVLENKVESYEKENGQLKKALERSDSYIEGMEKEVEELRQQVSHCKCGPSRKAKDSKFHPRPELKIDDSLDTDLEEVELRKKRSHATRKVNFDSFDTSGPAISENTSSLFDPSLDPAENSIDTSRNNQGAPQEDDTFDLEAPSPMTPGTSVSRISLETPNETLEESMDFDKDADVPLFDAEASNGRKRLRFNANQPSITASKYSERQPPHQTPTKTTSGPSDLNISMTPEIEDCMRLFDEAERKVSERKVHMPQNEFLANLGSWPGPGNLSQPGLGTTMGSTSVNFQGYSSHGNMSLASSLPARLPGGVANFQGSGASVSLQLGPATAASSQLFPAKHSQNYPSGSVSAIKGSSVNTASTLTYPSSLGTSGLGSSLGTASSMSSLNTNVTPGNLGTSGMSLSQGAVGSIGSTTRRRSSSADTRAATAGSSSRSNNPRRKS